MDHKLLTVLYADIFDYPLTRDELNRWMIMSSKRVARSPQHFYFLKGREHTVTIRKERARWQREKWDIARRAAAKLSRIPTILLVGVTGGLAMNNARKDDDIDLYLVVEDDTLWTSRLLATAIMDISGLRRHPDDNTVADKICLNMVVTEMGLAIPEGERDLFSAHEVLQMQPVFVRGNTYKRFLHANVWVQKFLPNAWRYRNTI